MNKRRIFAGERLKSLRDSRDLKQADMASRLGISVSYLSQLEHNDRPLTPALLEALSRDFPIDWDAFEEDTATRRFAALREAAADPLFTTALSPEQLTRFAEQQPVLADQFIHLHAAYRRAGERIQIVDEAMSSDNVGGSRLPWEEVRDWFHDAGNYVDPLDRAAEAMAVRLKGFSPTTAALERYLRQDLGISLVYQSVAGLREFDATMRHLVIDQGQPAEGQRFQLAHQLAEDHRPVPGGAALRRRYIAPEGPPAKSAAGGDVPPPATGTGCAAGRAGRSGVRRHTGVSPAGRHRQMSPLAFSGACLESCKPIGLYPEGV